MGSSKQQRDFLGSDIGSGECCFCLVFCLFLTNFWKKQEIGTYKEITKQRRLGVSGGFAQREGGRGHGCGLLSLSSRFEADG